uniref:Putative ribosome-binding factor a mitochondrial n=1 Tax=Culex tarsalis TaxID=7177 RepID=A0A1Q3F6H6_CULTA
MFKLVHKIQYFSNVRPFHCGCVLGKSLKKQGTILNKLLHGSDKGKRKWYADRNTVLATPLAITNSKGQGKESNRRISVLNKLFMEQITDLMATGEHAEELVGYGIQISRVKVSSDYHGINVFWFSRDNHNDMDIGRLLKRISGGLRHELSQLRLIGQVPKLNFVKDKTYGLTADLDGALRRADYGEDFVPTDRTLMLKSEFKLQVELPRNVRSEIDKLEDEIDYPVEDQRALPAMRNDILGLDQEAIMGKIRRSLNKNKAAWQQHKQQNVSDPELKGKEQVQFKKFFVRPNANANLDPTRSYRGDLVEPDDSILSNEMDRNDSDFIIEEPDVNGGKKK